MGNLSTVMFATTDENGVVGAGRIIIAFGFIFDFSGYSDARRHAALAICSPALSSHF